MHFEESCFNRTLDVTRLRDGTIPSLFLQPTRASYLQPSTSKVMVDDISSEPVLLEMQNKTETCSAEAKPPEANLVINASVAKMRKQNEIIKNLTKRCKLLKEKVKRLNEKVRRRDKKISRFSDIIKDLQNMNFINNE